MDILKDDQFNRKKVYISLVLLICLFAGAFFVTRATAVDNSLDPQVEYRELEAFEDVEVEAEAVYVWDAKNRRMLYGSNIEDRRPLASLSKVMTALVAYEQLEGRSIHIADHDLMADGDSGLSVGEVWRIKDLIDFTLLVSSNDGARAIASAFGSLNQDSFVTQMNIRARELGLKNMYFNNPSGLDEYDLSGSGGYGSVRDIVHLFDYILRTNPTILEVTRTDEQVFYSNFGLHRATNTNKLVNEIPFLVASKTGYTDLAGGNLVVAIDVEPNHPVIIGVLGSSREGRFRDMEELYRATMTYIKQE